MDSTTKRIVFHPEVKGAVGSLIITVIVGLIVLVWSAASGSYIISILALVGTPGLLFLYSKYLQKTKYTVTEEKIMKDTEIFGHSHEEIPIDRVQNTNLSQSGLQKKFGDYGMIEISTAGSGSTDMRMTAVPNADDLYDEISTLVRSSDEQNKPDRKFVNTSDGESVLEEAQKLNEVSGKLRSKFEGDNNE